MSQAITPSSRAPMPNAVRQSRYGGMKPKPPKLAWQRRGPGPNATHPAIPVMPAPIRKAGTAWARR